MINLQYKSKFEPEQQLEPMISQQSRPTPSSLPLSRRISSIFKEFVTGMKLAHLQSGNKNIEIDVLISHNLRLLHKRLLQVPEYMDSFNDITRTGNNPDTLWQSLFEERDVKCGFLTIQPHQDMPCYCHPGMNSMYLVLAGNAGLNEYALQAVNNEQVNFDITSSRDLTTGDTISFSADNTRLTNLNTADEACILLNVQLSWQHKLNS